MLVNVIENPQCKETKITIECKQSDEHIAQIANTLKGMDNAPDKLFCSYKGEWYLIDPKNVYYFESVERKCFCYCEKEVYETEMRLYEIEDKFAKYDYIRVSKACVVNISRIKSIRPDFGGKIIATMQNGEKIFVSRQYASSFKMKLGIGGVK